MVMTSAELVKVASSPFDKGYLLCATPLLDLALSADGGKFTVKRLRIGDVKWLMDGSVRRACFGLMAIETALNVVGVTYVKGTVSAVENVGVPLHGCR
jgi:hypothetical protein